MPIKKIEGVASRARKTMSNNRDRDPRVLARKESPVVMPSTCKTPTRVVRTVIDATILAIASLCMLT